MQCSSYLKSSIAANLQLIYKEEARVMACRPSGNPR